MPPQRRKTGPSGPPRRRPKVAGTSRPPRMSPAEDERPTSSEDERPSRTERTITPPEQVGTGPVETPAEKAPAEPSRPSEVTFDKQEKKQEKPAPAAGDVTGTPAADPVETATEPVDPPEPPAGEAGGSRASGGWRPVIVVGAVAVVLAVIAAVAAFRPGADVSNVAWVDTAETREVTEAAKVAIETMHGYDYRTIDEDFAAAEEFLTEEFAEKRAQLFQQRTESGLTLREQIVEDQVVVVAAVAATGLTRVSPDGDRATVVVYVDQDSQKGEDEPNPLRMWATLSMVEDDGDWLIDDICTEGDCG